MANWGRETIEGLLTLGAYLAYAEYCSLYPRPKSVLFKGLAHRSAGPLWNLLKQTLQRIGTDAFFATALTQVLREPWFSEIDNVISQITQPYHGKEIDLDYPRTIYAVGNIVNQAFAGKVFGYFENVKPKPFSIGHFDGIFRNARGPSQPFVELLEFSGTAPFSQELVFVCDPGQGKGLCLSPLVYWGLESNRLQYAQPDFYVFDRWSDRDKVFGYKAVERRKELEISNDGSLAVIFDQLTIMRQEDCGVPISSGLILQTRVPEERELV